MKSRCAAGWFIIPLLYVSTAQTQQAVESVRSRITAVTVYADRARVERAAGLRIPAGVSVWRFAELPGWIDEESVRASISPATGIRVADVRIERDYLARPADDEVVKAEVSLREISDRQREIDDERRALDAEARQVEEARVFAMEKLPKEAVLGPINVESYAKAVEFVGAAVRRIAAARRALDDRQRDLAPELAVRARRLDELRQRARLEQRTVSVTLEAAAAAETTLTLSYQLPGASWQPAHELRAEATNPATVTLASFAVVSQTTGEDWDGAALSFSTQSPGETLRIPELEALRLGLPAAAVASRASGASSFNKAKQLFTDQNGFWFQNWNPRGDLQAYRYNEDNRRQIEQQAEVVFQRLKERGTLAHFAGEGRPVVRSDGSLVRVPIGRAELAAKLRIVAIPELSLNALRTVELVHSGVQPLLPGRVAIFERGAFVGFTDTDFVAEGETFSLMLGVAESLKLGRVMDRKMSSIARGSRTRLQVAFQVTVENLSAEPVRVRLQDRVPVSEDREIRVFGVDIKPDGRPDDRGLLTWDLDLRPKEKRLYRIAYGIEYPPAAAAVNRAQRAGGPPQPAADLYEQIERLEAKF